MNRIHAEFGYSVYARLSCLKLVFQLVFLYFDQCGHLQDPVHIHVLMGVWTFFWYLLSIIPFSHPNSGALAFLVVWPIE